MKLNAITTALAFGVFATAAFADNQSRRMDAVTVSARPIAECVQLGQPSSDPCEVARQLIRANFTPAEIRQLATWQATHPLYLLDEIHAFQDRYDIVRGEYLAQQEAAKQLLASEQVAGN